jgi:methionyl-tRNA formyltransferase
MFFGSMAASAEVLEDVLSDDGLEVVGVVTQASKAHSHRSHAHTPVALTAAAHNCPIFTPAKLTPDVIAELSDLKPDIGVLFAYGKMLPDALLAIFPRKIVNIHPSLLPRHRGPAPLEATILHGDTTAGTSIMIITSEMDAGPILAQDSFPISAHIAKQELWLQLVQASRKLLLPTLHGYLGGTIQPQPQDDARDITFSHLIRKMDGMINPREVSAVQLERQIRAYLGWPGSRLAVTRNGRPTELLIHEVSVLPDEASSSEPSLSCEQRQLILTLKTGCVRIDQAQLPGKSIVSGRDLCNSGDWELATAEPTT